MNVTPVTPIMQKIGVFRIHRQLFWFSRTYSSQVDGQKTASTFDEEWKDAKPFSAIPKISALTFIFRMFPGGLFFKILNLKVIHNFTCSKVNSMD